MRDYYRILNVSESASAEEIRRAFRVLAFSCHPDLAGDGENNREKFILIREAYETLINEEKRVAYGARLRDYRSQKVGMAGVFAAERKPPVKRKTGPVNGLKRNPRPVVYEAAWQHAKTETRPGPLDIRGNLEVTLEDSLRSAIYLVQLSLRTGKKEGVVSYSVRLPGKLFEGAILRVPRLGRISDDGIQRGDLFIEIVFAKHEQFRVVNHSIFLDWTIQPWQAALGFVSRMPTLEGEETLNVPAFTNSPMLHRLPGKGVFRPDGERGDFWVNLRLEIKPPETYRARRLWAELAEEYRNMEFRETYGRQGKPAAEGYA